MTHTQKKFAASLGRILAAGKAREATVCLARLDLERYDVLVLPNGRYGASSGFDSSAAKRLSTWVRKGGTLVVIKGAAEWACGEDIGLLETGLVRKIVERADRAKVLPGGKPPRDPRMAPRWQT